MQKEGAGKTRLGSFNDLPRHLLGSRGDAGAVDVEYFFQFLKTPGFTEGKAPSGLVVFVCNVFWLF